MKDVVTRAVAAEVAAMRKTKAELASHAGLLSLQEATDACPFEVSDETLRTYPEAVLPRIRQQPKSRKRHVLYFDPRDVAALPIRLDGWWRSIEAGEEEQYLATLQAEHDARQRAALQKIMAGAA